jgi:GTP cyclohydrolase I
MRKGVRLFLEGIGRHRLGREFDDTVARVTEAWSGELLRGYSEKPAEILKPLRARSRHGWVVARDLAFYSQCVHHLLPFFGRAHVAFLPARSLVGLSKLGRLVQCFARRLQIQEEMTDQILAALVKHLRPRGAAVVVEAQHLCMSARGARAHGGRILTAAFSGLLERDAVERQSVLRLLGAPRAPRDGRLPPKRS